MASASTPPVQKVSESGGEVRVIGGIANAYLVEDGSDHYLVDAGFNENAKPVIEMLSRAGVDLHSLKGILITHQHADHFGGAAKLRWLSQAPVVAHRFDAKAIEGIAPRSAPLFVRVLFHRHPVKVTNMLGDQDPFGPFSAIHLPGHTPGSLAYYHKEKGLLFTGDALIMSDAGHLALSRKGYNYDTDSAALSLKKLEGLRVSAIYPGHGNAVTKDAQTLLANAIERLSKETVVESKTMFGPEGRPEIHPGMPGWREG